MTMRPHQSDVAEREVLSPVKSVLLIDNHPVVALGIELAFRGCPNLSLVKKVANPAAAIPAIMACSPDAIVLDLVFDGTIHFSLIQKAQAAMPSAIVVVFSSLPAELYEQAALDAGANFFLSKDHDCSDLVGILSAPFSRPISSNVEPVVKTLAGRRAIGPSGSNYEAHLTPRESEIAALLSRGLSVAEIAHLVGASKKTVSVHRDNVRIKLRCRDSTELVARLARIYATRKAYNGADAAP